MERLEVTILISILKLFSVVYFVAQLLFIVPSIFASGRVQVLDLTSLFIVPLGAYSLALIIDLLSGIELSLRTRVEKKDESGDWQAHPPKNKS